MRTRVVTLPRRCARRLLDPTDLFQQPERADDGVASWGRCGERAWNAFLPYLQERDLRRECSHRSARSWHRRFEWEPSHPRSGAAWATASTRTAARPTCSATFECSRSSQLPMGQTTAPGKAPDASSGVPDVPVLPQSLDLPAGTPPDYSAASTTEEAPEPAAGELVVPFNM